MPPRCAFSVRKRDGQLVAARLRSRRRPEPDRESVHRLRPHTRTLEPAVSQPRQDPTRDGDPCRRSCFPFDRLGMGWILGRLDKGLHALFLLRPLALRSPSLSVRSCTRERESAHRASAARRLDVRGRVRPRPSLAQAPALASPCEIEREPGAEGSGDAGERDRDPARGFGGRGRRRADEAGGRTRRQRQATAGAANRVLD
jgi:hypothetical protein